MTRLAIRLSRVLALVGCVACQSGGRKTVEAPRPAPVAAAPAAPAPAAPAAAPAAPAADNRADGPPDCRFQRPAAWTEGRVSWLGACHDGFADGQGVLIDVAEGDEPERFYGLLQQGRPQIGVLQTSGGFQAGHWEHGTLAAPLPDDVAQRNATLDAFRAGAAAATAASKSVAKKDAQASRFYAKQARVLRDQID